MGEDMSKESSVVFPTRLVLLLSKIVHDAQDEHGLRTRHDIGLVVLDALLERGGEIEWRCQHGRGGERLCREVNSYDSTLHATCGKVLVIPVSASRSTPT